MMKLLKIGFWAVTIIAVTGISSIAQEKEPVKRGIGRANFYISIKDQIGITQAQEDKLMAVEKDAIRKLEEVNQTISSTQQALNTVLKDDDIDLKKAKDLLEKIGALEADAKFLIIVTGALEKRILTKEQREKADNIVREMSKGAQPPPAPPVKKSK